jgi:hypothetical protein
MGTACRATTPIPHFWSDAGKVREAMRMTRKGPTLPVAERETNASKVEVHRDLAGAAYPGGSKRWQLGVAQRASLRRPRVNGWRQDRTRLFPTPSTTLVPMSRSYRKGLSS